MKLCPICDGEATSPHHIKPRAEGGSDKPRNIIYLCKRCHDEIEEREVTPQLLRTLRQEMRDNSAVSQEEYWYIVRDNGLYFLGVKEPGKAFRSVGIFFPDKSSIDLQR